MLTGIIRADMQILRGLSSPDSHPIALTIGNFDGVHLGHQALLKQLMAAAKARNLDSAVLVFEPHPREFFSPQQAPARLTNLREKLECFEEMGLNRVYVCHFDEELAKTSALDFVDILQMKLQAKFVLIGDDFRFGSGRLGDFDLMRQRGLALGFDVQAMASVCENNLRVSSTAVRLALQQGDLKLAESLLGRHYSMSGRVEHGQHLGRKLGYPTANIQLKHNCPPLTGVFAVQMKIEAGAWLNGVASLGVRPTVEVNGKPILEVHLFDFAEEIYEQHVQVAFLKKLRDEKKFDGLESLKLQIDDDAQRAKQFFATTEQELRTEN
jgi:riboflavin kinase/FMN adenylyltransferase